MRPTRTGFQPPARDTNGPRVNSDIRVPSVRLVGPEGEIIGVVPIREALARAEEAGLDLVEISPGAEPPVCKILDFGKYSYELQKKAAEARKKQKIVDIKEIKVRPNIGEHDLQIKMKQVRQFIEEGDKVKFSLRFRGRESSHSQLGFELMNRIKTELGALVKVEHEPKLEGQNMLMVVSPAKA